MEAYLDWRFLSAARILRAQGWGAVRARRWRWPMWRGMPWRPRHGCPFRSRRPLKTGIFMPLPSKTFQESGFSSTLRASFWVVSTLRGTHPRIEGEGRALHWEESGGGSRRRTRRLEALCIDGPRGVSEVRSRWPYTAGSKASRAFWALKEEMKYMLKE